MFLFQVFVHRELTPNQGQEYLDRMFAEAERNGNANDQHVVKLPGVSRFEDPFPDWIKQILIDAGMVYESVNMTFYRKFQHEHQALSLMSWFDNEIRPWAQRQGKDLRNIHVRVMDEHDEVHDKASF